LHYFIDPFGCVKNQVDAENMMACLDNAGWSPAENPADADLIIVNSCGFIESAKRESIDAVLGWRKTYPDKKILLAGCLAQRYAKDLAESLPEADGFFGVDDIDKIAEKASSVVGGTEDKKGVRDRGSGNREQGTDFCPPTVLVGNRLFSQTSTPIPDTRYLIPSARPLLSTPGCAYVKISEGCDNRCSFCAIPLIRGPLRCRALPDIVQECRGLLARGIKELCIIGQDICSYRYRSGNSALPELLRAIAELPGNFRARLLYMHPDHFPEAVLDVMESDGRFLPYFDIPFQHASRKILSAMNRRGAAETYLALVEKIRSRLPAAVIRTTFLLGFPGETDADFACLLDFQEKLRPDWLGCFTYSREEGTSAWAMKPRVAKKVAALRRREIEIRQVAITEKSMDRFIGQNLDVLLEGKFTAIDEGVADLWLGRLYCHAPEVDGAAVVTGAAVYGDGIYGDSAVHAGELVPCTVIARRGFDLEVRIEA